MNKAAFYYKIPQQLFTFAVAISKRLVILVQVMVITSTKKHKLKLRTMKKLVTLFLVAAGLVASTQVSAQTKIGYISVQELVIAMPEFKKADTALAEYQNALNQQYAEMVEDFNMRDSLLSSKDTQKYTKAQIEVKRRDLGQLYVKLQGWNQQAQQLYNAKEQEQLQPVYDKARKAIQDVAKENGFTYVFSKEQLIVSPPGDDMMALVKRKLNLK